MHTQRVEEKHISLFNPQVKEVRIPMLRSVNRISTKTHPERRKTQTEPSRFLSQRYQRQKSGKPPDLTVMLVYLGVNILSRLILAGYQVKQTKTELIITPMLRKTQRIIILPDASETMKGEVRTYTSEDLQCLISGIRLRLDCGHHCTVGHNLTNTLIIDSLGGGRLETCCHSCY